MKHHETNYKTEAYRLLNAANQRRYKTNPIKRECQLIRTALQNAIRTLSIKNKDKIPSRLSFTRGRLIEHLEKQFSYGMSWGNYGTLWEIDHILPLQVQTSIKEVHELNNLNNIRPLLKAENRKKLNKLNN